VLGEETKKLNSRHRDQPKRANLVSQRGAGGLSLPVQIRGRWSRTDDERARGPRRETRLQLDHNSPLWPKRRQGEEASVPRRNQERQPRALTQTRPGCGSRPAASDGRDARPPSPSGPHGPAARRNRLSKFSTVSTQVSGDSRSRHRSSGDNSAGIRPRLSGRVRRPVQSTNLFPASRQSHPESGSDRRTRCTPTRPIHPAAAGI